MSRILACIVLYKMSLAESETYRTLLQAIEQVPGCDHDLTLFIADNSPEPEPLPVGFDGKFVADGANMGLARRYNQALEEAERVGAEWLLTLDQDTSLTAAYLQEILHLTSKLSTSADVAVILPKLAALGRLYSPHTSYYYKSPITIDEQTCGLMRGLVYGFNSAAAIRVTSLRRIGGYDERYWLDYLDHATFARLQRRKQHIYVMKETLIHELSVAHGEVSEERLSNIHRAEQMFYIEHSYGREWLGRKINLARQVVGKARRGYFSVAYEKLLLLIGRIP